MMWYLAINSMVVEIKFLRRELNKLPEQSEGYISGMII